MKLALLSLALLTCISCSPPAEAPAPKEAQAPAPTAASAGVWKGDSQGTTYTITLKKDGFAAEWVEAKGGESKTWTGKWRDEGDELYLLLSKPGNRSALFSKKGDVWEATSIDDAASKLTLTRSDSE